MKFWVDRLASALGALTIVADDTHLCALEYEGHDHRMMTLLQRRYKSLEFCSRNNPLSIAEKLSAYLNGEFEAIADIPVNPGGTPFQQSVWNMLQMIPKGQTWTYGQLAIALGKPTASRAVGMANSQNPIAIVIPCHRVIGAKNAMTGYSGGIERKRWLLEHEGGLPQTKTHSLTARRRKLLTPSTKQPAADGLPVGQQLSLL